MEPEFFKTQAAFERRLAREHENTTEIWLGLYRKSTGRASLTYPEALDAALCHGWIDGLRKPLDTESYAIRFTPRKAGSPWSLVNIRRVRELIELGRMSPAGLKAFEDRDEARAEQHSQARNNAALDAEEERMFQSNPTAWEFYARQTASYRKAAAWWVVSAKRPETRRKRLLALIADSELARAVPPLINFTRLKP